MASLVTCVVTSVTWCFCSAFTSLLGSCCGNDKASTVPAGPTSGRKRSVFLLFLSICISIGFQYGLAPFFVDSWTLSTVTTFFEDTWLDGCEHYKDDVVLQKRCAGNNGNFRVSAATTLFFVIAGIAVALRKTANREAWPAKFILYLFLVAATAFIPSDPIFSSVYLNIARVGGIIFILIQQLIILDVAFNWNDSWVEKSNKAESDEGPGAGKKWLGAILGSCIILFGSALVGFILLVIYYTGCTTNNAFIWLTLIFCIFLTVAQLSGEEASLLSSACISVWAMFLCFSAVSKNPNGQCNPQAGENNWLSTTLGMIATLISLLWAGWSWTAEDKLVYPSKTDDEEANNINVAGHNGYGSQNDDTAKPKVTGIVTGGNDDADNENTEQPEQPVNNKQLSNSWRLNAALATVSCWTAMVLTDWGAIQADGSISNAATGQTAMWMIMSSQWIVLTLYVWTLIAPRLFPDRDFS